MMATDMNRDPQTEAVWRSYLTTGTVPGDVQLPWYERPGMRAVARRLPADPRCQVCYYPFSGLGGMLLRTFLHVEPSRMNPYLCNICERFAEANPGGAEMEVALLFADIRGSTPLAATMNPYEFSRLINRFYQVTTNTIFEYGGMVATLIGDGVAAFFVPAFTEEHNYARAAVRAGEAILAATGHGKTEAPWVPVGVGVHTGEAYVGAVGEQGKHIDITVLGDNVNIAARLSGQAQQGELVISDETVRIGGLDPSGYEHDTLTLKGKDEPFDAWVYRAEK